MDTHETHICDDETRPLTDAECRAFERTAQPIRRLQIALMECAMEALRLGETDLSAGIRDLLSDCRSMIAISRYDADDDLWAVRCAYDHLCDQPRARVTA